MEFYQFSISPKKGCEKRQTLTETWAIKSQKINKLDFSELCNYNYRLEYRKKLFIFIGTFVVTHDRKLGSSSGFRTSPGLICRSPSISNI